MARAVTIKAPWADRGTARARIIVAEPLLARTVRGDLIDEREELFVEPVLRHSSGSL